MMLRKVFSLGFITAIYVNSACCLERLEFGNVDSFVKSFKNAEIYSQAEGDLMGKGRTDWAGIILLKDENQVQTYILEKLESGNYAVTEKSQTRSAFGGTGNFNFQGIEIKRGSLFIDFGYHYGQYRCDGNVISQFKLYKSTWRMIGVKSDEVCDCTGIRVLSDTNLITGKAIVSTEMYNRNRKHTKHFTIAPKVILFGEFVDGDEMMSMHEEIPVCQPCPFKPDE